MRSSFPSSAATIFVCLAFVLGGCSCSSDGGGGGGGGDADGSVDGGGGDGNVVGDGGDGDGGTGDGGSGGDGGVVGDGGTGPCVPQAATAVCAGLCGYVSVGCGQVVNCSDPGNGGVTCGAGTQCLTGNQCVPTSGGGLDGGTCVPKTCQELGNTCGLDDNGCGGLLNCWPNPNTPTCANGGACIPNANGALTCVTGTQTCSGDLCNAVDTCTDPGETQPTRLTGVVLTPGLDHDLNAGTAPINQIPVPNAIVYIPANSNATLPAIFQGVSGSNPLSCGRCADEQYVAMGESVLASAVTNYRGEFTLEGRIPVGQAFKLVIKAGKWRRVVNIANNVVTTNNKCTNIALTTEQTRLNRSSSDGASGTQLPRIAIGTGEVDEMECVLRNIGIAESEFTINTGAGRIHMYRMDGARMGTCNGTATWGGTSHSCSDSRTISITGSDNVARDVVMRNYGCWNRATPLSGDNLSGCSWTNQSVGASNLYGNTNTLNGYDMVVWDCEGDEVQHDSDEPRLETYVNNGGKMFASHFAYTWIENNGTLDASADWGTSGSIDSAVQGYVSMPTGSGFTTIRARANDSRNPLFRNWLDYLGALDGTTAGMPLESPPTPQFAIREARDRAGANAGPSTDEWMYRIVNTTQARIQQLSFNTPYGSAETAACGRVAYSGFHVTSTDNNDSNDYFPSVCSDDGNEVLSPQELVLVYMLFDLNACVSSGDPVTPPTCTPRTAAEVCPNVNDACGYLSDGCGGIIDCMGCDPSYTCVGNQCVAPPMCTPATCASLGYVCGQFADGCGGIADNAQGNDSGCGVCPDGQYCGSNGQCYANCTPLTPATGCTNRVCGQYPDGCGGVYSCGTCPIDQQCVSDGAVCIGIN